MVRAQTKAEAPGKTLRRRFLRSKPCCVWAIGTFFREIDEL